MPRATVEPVAVAILAKAPAPGEAKTRLASTIGNDAAAALQARLIAHAADTALRAAVGPVTLWASPDATHPLFQSLAAEGRIVPMRQPEGDLGARMLAAIAANCPALVIGTDCPALTPDHLRTAADALRDGLDAVVIPAEDGGYVLIGLRRPQPALFTGFAWSTDTVMADTRRQLARLNFAWREPARLWDVDRPADLARMQSEGFASLLA